MSIGGQVYFRCDGTERAMKKSDFDELERLKAVQSLNLLDQPEEERFHRITRLARQHFRAGICAVTLIDKERAFYVAQEGLKNRDGGERQKTPCNKVVMEKSPFVVADLSKEARSSLYRGLVDRLDLHFYAGVPLLSQDGHAVGAFCIMDHKPRRFSRRDLESLADFAALVEDQMTLFRTNRTQRELISQLERLRVRAFIDPLTNVWNRGAIFDLLGRELERARRTGNLLSICLLDLDHFKSVNDEFGHQSGDKVLTEFCRRLRDNVRSYDSIGRYGGEEFLVVFPETDASKALSQAERMRRSISEQDFQLSDGTEKTITVSIGVATFNGEEDIKALIERADKALYRAKNEGRNRTVADS